MPTSRFRKGPALLPEHVLEDLEEQYAMAMRRWHTAVLQDSPHQGAYRVEMNRLEVEVRRVRHGY